MRASRHLCAIVLRYVIAKPIGHIYNRGCEYCDYLAKEEMYADGRFRMEGDMLDGYLKQLIGLHSDTLEVTILWQGGEPTRRGFLCFEHAMRLAEYHRRFGRRFIHTIRMNGTLNTEEWTRIFRACDSLAGRSLDAPEPERDICRDGKQQKPTWHKVKVMKALRIVHGHGFRLNIRCTVNVRNAADDHPEVYRFLRKEYAVKFVACIPVVERTHRSSVNGPFVVAQGSLVLSTISHEWRFRDVGRVFGQTFEEVWAT